ncbi:MAG: hypothetical protein M3235_09285 [Actinomycetota bacterium]|nr:hypothetical protein [Actinomycetota bacterium]
MTASDEGLHAKRQDPRVERLRPQPGMPPPRTRALEGLWGDSDREGHARLYLTQDLAVYAEFLVADVVVATEIPPEQAPFVGEQATHIELPRDANVDITRSKRAAEIDEFDLDVRFGRARMASVGFASSGPNECMKGDKDTEWPCGHTCDPFLCKTFVGPGGGECPGGGPDRSADCGTDTCATCVGATQCGTCQTDPGETQCGTCHTDFGATRCGTCHTDFGATDCGGCERARRR